MSPYYYYAVVWSFLCHDALTEHVKSGSYKSGWFPQELWEETWRLPNAGVFGSGPQACSLACLMHYHGREFDADACQAFTIVEGQCEFGKLRYGPMVSEVATGAIKKVWYSKEFYSTEQVTHVYRVGHSVPTFDPVDTERAAPLEVPEPHGERFKGQPVMVNYKKNGLLVVGGAAEDLTVTKSWFPGDAEWSALQPAGSPHEFGAGLALDAGYAVMVACGLDASEVRNSKVELFERGSWYSLADYPEAAEKLTLVEGRDNTVYGIGGAADGVVGHSPHVYRYSRIGDTWTAVQDVPNNKGTNPNCAKIQFRGKDSIVCVGSKGNPDRLVDVLDLELETWTTLANIRAAEPATSASLVFTLAHRLFRVRGQASDGSSPYTMDVFDADRETWESPVQLEPVTLFFNKLARLTVSVIVPKI